MNAGDILVTMPERIRSEGWCPAPPLTNDQVADVLAWLRSRPFYVGGHVRQACAARPAAYDDLTAAEFGCWHHHDVLRAPHLLELALRMTPVAAAYLGVPTPWLYSVNAFVTRPGQRIRPDIQDWHCDRDDVRFLPLFVYLTDVGADGAQLVDGPKGQVEITGPAGFAFFSDTFRRHMGRKPARERIVAWARWGVTERPGPGHAYTWDGLTPLPAAELGGRYPVDPWLRDSIKLLVVP